jgi:hypothetical protein
MEKNSPIDREDLARPESLHEASRPSGLDLAARVYRGLISFDTDQTPLIEDAYRLVRERRGSQISDFGLDDPEARLNYFDKIQGMLESDNEFPEYSSEFFDLESSEYEELLAEFDAYARDTAATYSAIEAVITDMRNPLNKGQRVFKRIFGHFSQVNEKLGAQLSYSYFFNGNPFDPELDKNDRYGIHSSVQNYFKRELLQSVRRYSFIEDRLEQDFKFAGQLQHNTHPYINRPGILPVMDLIRRSSKSIDIDIFQLQNESVMDMLIAKKIDNPALKIRVKLASLDEGRIDRVSSDILAPNSYVSGVLEALNRFGEEVYGSEFVTIEIKRARSRNHPKLIVGDTEAIIGSMNLTYPLGNNPLKAGANFEIIRRVRNEEEELDKEIQGKISRGLEISQREYDLLEKDDQKKYLNTYLYHQLKQAMDYNMERFDPEAREEDVPFDYKEFKKYIGKEKFGTGTALVGGPSDMYTLLDISLGKLEENRETGRKYGLLMNIDQPLILQGVLGKAAEVGYRVGEFGPFNAKELSLLDEVMENFEKKSLQLLESIGRGEAFVVVDPRNYRTKVLNPFRAILDPLIGSDLTQYGGRLEQLVAAKASGTDYNERLRNLTNYMRERVSRDQSGLAEGLAKQMLAITSSNIQMATHPKAHAKGFSLFEVVEKGIEYLINSMGSGNYTPGSTLPSLEALKRITGRDDISEEDYRELAKTSSNELSLQGYDPQVVEDRYDVGGSGFLAKELAKEQGEHLEHSFDELTYSGKFADIQRSIEEGGPSKFQGTDARWEQGVDIGRTAALQERIQTMFDESGLGERGATAELIRDNKSNASRILVTLNYNQLTEGSGLANKKYELSVMQGGQVYLINKGLIVSSAVFTNESGMTIENFMGEGPLASGETKDLSSEDVAVSLFGTLALEALHQGLIEMPESFSQKDTSNSALYYYIADILGIAGKVDPLSEKFYQELDKRFDTSASRLVTLAKFQEELFSEDFLRKVDTADYQSNLKKILTDEGLTPRDRLEKIIGLLATINEESGAESKILQRVYSKYSPSFSFELNERLQSLESDILKPFLTYTQSHTYSASTETTRKIRLGVSSNAFQRKAIEKMNQKDSLFYIAQYAALAVPYAGVMKDISQALITSVAGGLAQINQNQPLSSFFKTRSQSYEEVKSLDLIEILSLGSRLNEQVIDEYLIKKEVPEEEAEIIKEQFMAALGTGQFITTFGGDSKFSQIGQRLKNAGGSRALLEMSYSAQYLLEHFEGEADLPSIEQKIKQDVFGFLFERGYVESRAKAYQGATISRNLREVQPSIKKLIEFVNNFEPDNTLTQPLGLNERLRRSNQFTIELVESSLLRIDQKIAAIENSSFVEYKPIKSALDNLRKSGVDILTSVIKKSLEVKTYSEEDYQTLLKGTQTLLSQIENSFEFNEGYLNLKTVSSENVENIPSLQQAYVQNLRSALSSFGIDPNLAKNLVPDEFGVAAVAGGRIRSILPSDAYQTLIEERQRLMNITGKTIEFFDEPVGQELLRASLAYRDTETMGSRGFLGSRRKAAYSLFQLGGFYYDANFFYNPNYDEAPRYFFTDRVKKSIMANQLGLDNLKVEVQEGDIIKPISEGNETFGVYRPGKGKIGEVSDRSQVNAISNVQDSLSAHDIASPSTVTRKASVPPGREAIELVISKVERSSTSKAAIEVELSLIRSGQLTGGSRIDIAQGLMKGVGTGDAEWFEYASERLGNQFASADIFGYINESSLKSYIYGHGLTIAQDPELKQQFLDRVKKNPGQAAAALLYMFGDTPFGDYAAELKDTYTQKALSGEYGNFFKKEAIARMIRGENVLKSAYSALQTPSLGLSEGSEAQNFKRALENQSSSLISFLEGIVDSVSNEQTLSTTVGAGSEGLIGREADLIITAIDFYFQLVDLEDKTLISPAFDLSQDKSIRTLALGMGYSPFEIEDSLKDKVKKEELIETIVSQSSAAALRFYQVPTPGQMKTPLSSQPTSKAEIQTRLTPFITTGDSFSPLNRGVKETRAILTAGLLNLPSDKLPASAAIKATQNATVAGLGDTQSSYLFRQVISLQEAHRTLSSYKGPGLRAAKNRLEKLGIFESQLYSKFKKGSYNLDNLEKEIVGSEVDALDVSYIQKRIQDIKKDPSLKKNLEKSPEAAVRSIFFQAASNISSQLRQESLLFSQDTGKQFNVSEAQDFIKNLEASGLKTFGIQLPQILPIEQSGASSDLYRFALGEETSVTGVVLGGEYLKTLQTANLQDFVSEVLTTQYKLQEMLSEGHPLKKVLRKLYSAYRLNRGNTASLSLNLSAEEVELYTQFVNLLSKTSGQLTQSLSESYLKQVMGAQDSPGYVATGVGLLGLESNETVVPLAAKERTFDSNPNRKKALKDTIDQLSALRSDTDIEPKIDFLRSKAAALFEGISPEAQRFYNLYRKDPNQLSKLLGQDTLEKKIKVSMGKGDEYIYRLIKGLEEKQEFYEDYKLPDDVKTENRLVRLAPKASLKGIEKEDIEIYLAELDKEEYKDLHAEPLKNILRKYQQDLTEVEKQADPAKRLLEEVLAKIKFHRNLVEEGYEPFVRSLRSAPTGSLIISKSTFRPISISDLNKRYDQTQNLLKERGIDPGYKSQIHLESSKTLNILPLLSIVTTMLGDFDGDQIISSFVTYSDKIIRKIELNIEIKTLGDQILELSTASPESEVLEDPWEEKEVDNQEIIQRKRKTLERKERDLVLVEQELNSLKKDFNPITINRSVISHVSRYLGIDESYFLGGVENYFYQLMGPAQQAQYNSDKSQFPSIRSEDASLEEMVHLLEQGRGLTGSLEGTKSVIEELQRKIENKEFGNDPLIEDYINSRRQEHKTDRQIAQELAASLQSSNTFNKLGSLAKGLVQNESSLMLSLLALGQAGSVILGKTYNVLYGSLLADAPIIALKQSLDNNREGYIESLKADLNLTVEEAENRYKSLSNEVSAAFEKTQALKAFTMSIEQMMRDSFKPKKNKQFLEDLRKSVEEYQKASTDEERNIIVKELTKSLGSGPKGLLSLINLHDFVGTNRLNFGLEDKQKLLKGLLSSNPSQDLQIISQYLDISSITSIDQLSQSEIDKVINYIISRDSLNTSAGFMYERTYDLKNITSYLGENLIKIAGLESRFENRIKAELEKSKFIGPNINTLKIQDIKDLGLKQFLEYYNEKDSSLFDSAGTGEIKTQGFQAIEFWMGRLKDSTPLLGKDGEGLLKLKTLKQLRDTIVKEGEIESTGIETLDLVVKQLVLEAATRGRGDVKDLFKTLANIQNSLDDGSKKESIDQVIDFLTKQDRANLYNSEEASTSSRHLADLLEEIKSKLVSEPDTEKSQSKVVQMISSAFGLTYTGEAEATLQSIQDEINGSSRKSAKKEDYLTYEPEIDVFNQDPRVRQVEQWLTDPTMLFQDRIDPNLADQTASRFKEQGVEMSLETLLIPAIILGHAIATGYDPSSSTAEVIGQQVVGGAMISALYSTNVFSKIEQNKNKDILKRASAPLIGSAAKIRLTMAQDEEDDIVSGVIKTLSMEAAFTTTSLLTSRLIDTEFNRRRKVTNTLDIDALESVKTVASFVSTALISAAIGLTAQNAVKQVIRPSALETLQSVVANINQYVSGRRTQTARYETETVDMETEVDIPVYELTAITDYVQADMVSEHILSLSSTEMSGELIEEPIFVRSAEGEEV